MLSQKDTLISYILGGDLFKKEIVINGSPVLVQIL